MVEIEVLELEPKHPGDATAADDAGRAEIAEDAEESEEPVVIVDEPPVVPEPEVIDPTLDPSQADEVDEAGTVDPTPGPHSGVTPADTLPTMADLDQVSSELDEIDAKLASLDERRQ